MKKMILTIILFCVTSSYAEKDYTEKYKREKYPSKVYKPGKDIYKLMEEHIEAEKKGKLEPYEMFLYPAELARSNYEPCERDIAAGQGVYKKDYGRHYCTRDTCQFRFDGALFSLINRYITKKLNEKYLVALKGVYPYLSDYYKVFYFNAAVQYNQLELVKSYLEQGFDPNEGLGHNIYAYTTEVNWDESSPEGIPERLKSELQVRGLKPIDAATEYGYVEMIEVLRNSGKLE